MCPRSVCVHAAGACPLLRARTPSCPTPWSLRQLSYALLSHGNQPHPKPSYVGEGVVVLLRGKLYTVKPQTLPLRCALGGGTPRPPAVTNGHSKDHRNAPTSLWAVAQ